MNYTILFSCIFTHFVFLIWNKSFEEMKICRSLPKLTNMEMNMLNMIKVGEDMKL